MQYSAGRQNDNEAYRARRTNMKPQVGKADPGKHDAFWKEKIQGDNEQDYLLT